MYQSAINVCTLTHKSASSFNSLLNVGENKNYMFIRLFLSEMPNYQKMNNTETEVTWSRMQYHESLARELTQLHVS